MNRLTASILLSVLVVVACGGDDASGDDTTLTSDEREWCSFAGATDAAAQRFDEIFEAGLALGLPMDELNATASVLRTEYEESGLSPEDAVQAVSNDLLEDPTFVAACEQAYAAAHGG